MCVIQNWQACHWLYTSRAHVHMHALLKDIAICIYIHMQLMLRLFLWRHRVPPILQMDCFSIIFPFIDSLYNELIL